MKWFKHLSGSLGNSIIFEAIEIFGSDAYLVFFGTLELMSDEFDIHNPGINRLSIKKLTTNFQLSRQKTLRILKHFDQKAKENTKKSVSFFVDVENDHVVIKCKRLAELSDNHTSQLMRDTSKLLQSESELTSLQEEEVEEEYKEIKMLPIFNQKHFDLFYSKYPNKKGKQATIAKWKTLLKTRALPPVDVLLNSIQSQIDWRKNSNGEFRPDWKHPSTWLHQGCWEDEIEIKPKQRIEEIDI